MPERDESNKIMRLSPALAAEIGLNESIVLLQLQYLTHISTYEIESEKWIRGSLPDLVKENFPFLSVATLSRVITVLEKKGYIKTGRFNKFKYDRTQWVSVLLENCSKLNGFYIFQNETSILQIASMQASNLQDASKQNETTIQEIQDKTQEEIQEENTATGVAGAQSAPPVTPVAKTPKKRGGASKSPDERTKHPAIQAYRAAARRYPSLGVYDLVILRVGENPDLEKLTKCRVTWIERGFNPNAAVWATEWYPNGIPPPKNQVRGSPKLYGDALLVSNLVESENWLKKFEVMNDQPRSN